MTGLTVTFGERLMFDRMSQAGILTAVGVVTLQAAILAGEDPFVVKL